MADKLSERLEAALNLSEVTDDAHVCEGDARRVFVGMLPEDFEALLREAAELARRRCEAQPNRVRVYAAEWNDCVYESGYEVISLHASKAGAWRAGHQKAFARAIEDREASQLIGADLTRGSWRWRVRTYIVEK